MAITAEMKQEIINDILNKIEGSFINGKDIIVPTNNGHSQVKLKLTGCRDFIYSDFGNGERAKSKNGEKEECYEKFLAVFGERAFINKKEIFLFNEDQTGEVHLTLTVPREMVTAETACTPEKLQQTFDNAEAQQVTEEEQKEVEALLERLGF